jgi:carboxylesterase
MIIAGGQPYFLAGGPFGCLLIHDFTTCPKEIRWLGTQLNEAGFTVLAIRLFGHGTCPKDLQRTRFKDWIANVEDGLTILKNQCDKSIVIGISLGGALALIAGAKMKVDGVVAISTPYQLPASTKPRSLKILVSLIGLVGLGQRSIIKPPFTHRMDAILPKGQLSYDSFPPRVLLEVNGLFAEMQRVLPHISAPTLLIEAEVDQEGESTAKSQVLEHLSTRRTKLVKVKPGFSDDSPSREQERISAAIIQFVASLSGPKL